MENRIKQILFAVIVGIVVISCDDPGELGMELLPTTDLIDVRSLVDNDNSIFLKSHDSIRTDETGKSLLGSIVDPVFGKTTVDMACQYRMTYYPDFQDDAVVDSIFLYLFYRDFSGDTVTPQKLKVYELGESLSDSKKYYPDEDLESYKSDNLLAEYEFVPKITLAYDSTSSSYDTLYQTLKIPVDMELAERFLSADSADIWDIDSYFQFFKGVYFGVEEVEQNGTILNLEMLSNDYVNGSAIVMYYRETDPETEEADTLAFPLVAHSQCVRVNSYKHDYSGTPFETLINNEQQSSDQIYIQSTGGLKTKFYLPNLDSWKDSLNTAINKAELIFRVDTIASDISNFEPPEQLVLTFVTDEGEEQLTEDFNFNSSYYGGGLDTSDYTYRFNIAQHMQEIIKGNTGNNGFFLSAANVDSEYKRVILNGTDEENGVKLSIVYSKVLQ